MIFKIKTKSGGVVEIDHSIFPCCEKGIGEVDIIDHPVFGVCCSVCVDKFDDFGVFWWNEITDDEIEL